MQECIVKNYSYCEGEGMSEQELIRIYDAIKSEQDLIRIYDTMKLTGEIKDYRFTYLGTSRADNHVDIHELLHVRRNNDVVDVYSVTIRYEDGEVTRVKMEKLFSI